MDDREFRDYMRGFVEETRRVDMPGMMRRLHDEYLEHDKQDEVRHAELRGELRGLSLRVGAIEDNHEKLEKQFDDTGRFEITELRGSAQWYQRQRWIWIVGLASVLLCSAITGCVTYAVSHTKALSR